MGIKDKQTYGEYYWAMQVEAQAAFDEQMEANLSPYFRGIIADIPDITAMPKGIQTLLQALAEPPTAGFSDLIKLTGAEFGAEVLKDAMKPGMTAFERIVNAGTKETWLTSAQANMLFSRKKITEEWWDAIIASEGYEEVIGTFLYKAQLPYPSIPDLILYSRYISNATDVWGELQEHYNIDPTDFKIWEWLGRQRLTTEQVHTAYRRGVISEGELPDYLARIGWDDYDRHTIKDIGWLVPNAMLLVQGALQQERTKTDILSDISLADINPQYAQQYLDAILTKPSSIDIVNYSLRKDPKLSGIDPLLRKIGIHPDYFDIYKTLAYQIPPVADIITMAVREAFSPAIAERFGQYQDFPEPFAEWAAKKGLTEEWAKRYWAAHWSLPSPSQGFEMLHRGIINEDELRLLMRALDIMPFWRNKLMDMSYRRLTRVDVRRMYREGVLDEREVLEAYTQHGYAPENAKRMTEFTIRQTLSVMAKFTSQDVVSAYTKQMISRSEARSLLDMLGVRRADMDYIISTADYKRIWALTEQKITAVRNLYKRGVYEENNARDKLSKLDLPAERINVLMEQWLYEKDAAEKSTWTTAQTLKYIKDGYITRERGVKELRILGYDTEHIDVYMKAIK